MTTRRNYNKINKRGKRQYKIVKTSTDYLNLGVNFMHRAYVFDYRRTQEPIKQKVATKIMQRINERIWYYMITELWSFKAPGNMGEFRIKESTNSSGFFTNWGKSQKLGRHAKEYNVHSNGRVFYVFWDKTLCRSKHKALYKFEPYQGITGVPIIGSRGLATYIRQLSEDPTKPDYRAHIL